LNFGSVQFANSTSLIVIVVFTSKYETLRNDEDKHYGEQQRQYGGGTAKGNDDGTFPRRRP